MRVFVAIYPPLEIRESLLQTARELVPAEFRWVKPANVHLTLKFLGDIEEESLPGLRETLDAVTGRHELFEISPRGIGAFPSHRKARIVWAGVEEGADELHALAEDLEESLALRGFEKEKRGFKPHITLGRSRNRPGQLPEDPGDVEAPGFTARLVELVESSLGAEGAVYTTLSEYPLRGSPPRRTSDRE